jgi:hypothetical protein
MNYCFIMVKNSIKKEKFDFQSFLRKNDYSFNSEENLKKYTDILKCYSEQNAPPTEIFVLWKFLNWTVIDVPKLELHDKSFIKKLVNQNEQIAFFRYGDATAAVDEEIYEKGKLIHEITSELNNELLNSLSNHEINELLELPFRKPKASNLEKTKLICKDFEYNPDFVFEKLFSSSNCKTFKVELK